MRHSFGKHGTSVTCDACNESFKTFRELKVHTRIDHSKRKIHYKDNTHHKTKNAYPCQTCKKEFTRYYLFAKHSFLQHDVPIKCEKCGDMFDAVVDYRKHMKKKHQPDQKFVYKKENLPCDHCGKTYSCKISLSTHIQRVHEEHEQKKCPECDYETGISKYMEKHWNRNHTEAWKKTCEFCGKVTKKLKDHLKRGICGNTEGQLIVKSVPCSQCDKSFSTKDKRREHIKRIHIGEKGKKCGSCSYASYSNFNLKLHVSKMHFKTEAVKTDV